MGSDVFHIQGPYLVSSEVALIVASVQSDFEHAYKVPEHLVPCVCFHSCWTFPHSAVQQPQILMDLIGLFFFTILTTL